MGGGRIGNTRIGFDGGISSNRPVLVNILYGRSVMKLRNFLILLFLLGGAVFFAACEGDMGPAGPAGKDGVKGDKGDSGTPGVAGDKGNRGESFGDPRCDVSNGINALPGVSNNIMRTADDDIICGNQYINDIKAGDGDDTVYGAGGNGLLYGQNGDDTLYGEDGKDSIWGGDGDDTVISGLGGKSGAAMWRTCAVKPETIQLKLPETAKSTYGAAPATILWSFLLMMLHSHITSQQEIVVILP